MRFGKKEILFCEIHPACYWISTEKEALKRTLKDRRSEHVFASQLVPENLPNLVSKNSSDLIKKGPGIDPALQYNKANNIEIAARTMDGLILEPGEVYSFWRLVGRISERKGYRDGRVIMSEKLDAGLGGGLCNLANSVNLLILHSPLTITELHTHSDALAPDKGERRPFATGTSVAYKNLDYRFANTTDQKIQLRVWIANETLFAELRSEAGFENYYRLVEEDHHFAQEEGKFYRISTIYRETRAKADDSLVERTLILSNRSEVMYDYELIPSHQIRA
ncbi:vancomycin resistance protein [Rothia nasimurium]|uniref:Vancomycin resistance protein n=1 Tax=Rothia nasimurium TaxID=85336 RepID=A0A1Y1RN78_9MICC|nr:VanW family protein [Rothia nasimurium]ORC16024.1 vancomycin resistance protein [Rothia nasimurium]